MPLPGLILLSISIRKPSFEGWASRRAETATLATFFKGSLGNSCPVTVPICTPGVSVLLTCIRSPTGSKQNPSTSNPQETLATLAGAKILISSILSFSNSNDVSKNSSSSYFGSRSRPFYNEGLFFVSVGIKQNDVVTTF